MIKEDILKVLTEIEDIADICCRNVVGFRLHGGFRHGNFTGFCPSCREAVIGWLSTLSSPQKDEGVAFCSHCTEFNVRYEVGDGPAQLNAAEELSTHVRQCPANPLVAEVSKLRAEIDLLRGEQWDW